LDANVVEARAAGLADRHKTHAEPLKRKSAHVESLPA